MTKRLAAVLRPNCLKSFAPTFSDCDVVRQMTYVTTVQFQHVSLIDELMTHLRRGRQLRTSEPLRSRIGPLTLTGIRANRPEVNRMLGAGFQALDVDCFFRRMVWNLKLMGHNPRTRSEQH